MGLNMKVIGKMINSMAKVLKLCQITQNMMGNSKKEKSMEKEFKISLTDQDMKVFDIVNYKNKVSSMKITSMVMEHINGQIKGFILGIGNKIKCMEKVQSLGKMEVNTQG